MKVFVLKGDSYGDFDAKVEETLMVASTKEKANQVKRILDKFIQNDCDEYAKKLGHDMYSDDLAFGFFLRNDEHMRSILVSSLSCCMQKHETNDFVTLLVDKDIYCHKNVFTVEELFFYK